MSAINPAQYLSGIPFEKYICRFFELMGLGSQLDHNSFDPAFYMNDNHNVVDAVIKDKALIEMTNPKESTFMNDDIMQNKLDYFTRKDPKHLFPFWVLIVAFANFSDYIKSVIDQMGITLIVLNEHADLTNRATFIRHLFKSKLYSLAKRLKGKNSRPSAQYSTTTIPQYSATSSAQPIEQHLHRHEDARTDSTEEGIRGRLNRFPDRRRFDNKPRFPDRTRF